MRSSAIHRGASSSRLLAALLLLSLSRPALGEGIGPFTLESKDGKSSLSFGLTTQLRLATESREAANGSRALASTIEARRVRPTLSGTVLSPELRYYLHLSTAPGSLELIDLYLDYRFSRWFQVRAGRFKIPFTRYRIGSFRDHSFADWAITTRSFGSERQWGLLLHNGWERPSCRLEYEVGVGAGQNLRSSHGVGIADAYGEKLENPSDLTSPNFKTGLHPELVAHLAWLSPRMSASTETDWEGGPARYSFGLSAAWDLDPDRVREPALRLAAEAQLKIHGLSLTGIGYLALVRTEESATDLARGLHGLLLQTTFLARKRVELGARYAWNAIDSGLRDAARARADALIASARESERSALSSQYRDVGKLEGDHEITLALTAHLHGRSLKWVNDVSWLLHERSTGTRSDLRFRSQLQLAF
jgi:hypothetical protein